MNHKIQLRVIAQGTQTFTLDEQSAVGALMGGIATNHEADKRRN